MKKLTKTLLALLALAGTALQSVTVQNAIVSVVKPLLVAHPHVSAAVGALAAILTLLHNPTDPSSN